MWYRLDKGAVVGGPYNCNQTFPVTFLDEKDPLVVAFHQAVVPAPSPKAAAIAAVQADPTVPASVKAALATL